MERTKASMPNMVMACQGMLYIYNTLNCCGIYIYIIIYVLLYYLKYIVIYYDMIYYCS